MATELIIIIIILLSVTSNLTQAVAYSDVSLT